MKFQTVAVLMPNNNFLKGQLDISCEGIAQHLTSIGYDLKKISIVDENHETVINELECLFKLYDIVLILANEKPCYVSQALAHLTSEELNQQIECKTNIVLNKIQTLTWPKCMKLLKSKCNVYSVIYFQRIFILTMGLVEKQFNLILEEHLRHYQTECVFSKVYDIPCSRFKDYMSLFPNDNSTIKIEKYASNVEKCLLKLTSNKFENIVNSEKIMKERMGLGVTTRNCLGNWINTMYNIIYESPDIHIKYSIEIIEKCFEDFGLENVFLSFNGGKDCTVLLHLIQTVIEKKYPTKKGNLKLFCLYVRSELAFQEQDEFIDQCRIFFNLEVLTIPSNVKDALRLTLEQNPHFKACFMGTRRTDPYSMNLHTFEMTDSGWPQVMRCNPLLDWCYVDIWDYILYYKVPYCKLYNYGYTSLGNVTDTIRNPSLVFGNDKGSYLPAYKLLDEKKERIGRNISKM